MRLKTLVPVLIITAMLMASVTNVMADDPLARIQCVNGYTAAPYAEGLSSPDGLALSPAGVLYVAEEGAGRVSRIEADGRITPVVTGLNSPEGITFDDAGNLYVVEDVQNGRLLKVTPDGVMTTLASGLDAPEGIVWANDTLYVTESNVQFASELTDYVTQITAVSPTNELSTVRADPWFWSYAGITIGPDNLLYVTNEAAGTGTTDAVLIVNPVTLTRTVFITANLTTPEGLRFSAGNNFPLYIAEENTGDGVGQLSRVYRQGQVTTLCTGFGNIEDVTVDENNRLYISEDTTGRVIILTPSVTSQISTAAGRWAQEFVKRLNGYQNGSGN